ncbi:outer membrane beta-barrel protein [Helicobacter sp. faydin-H20]|uniref:outer membrane beta-barrel protein n=2 Tax=Campylobacterales TaxID=213849 RepID=UPI001E38805D|nr:outer membrane beta-barrel protein [Helicobacter anatolicus]MCE3037054.1 outer membrane beta-barrel protein [Helicobacter anatolicus]
MRLKRKILCVIMFFCGIHAESFSDDVEKILKEQELIRQKSGQYFSVGLGSSFLRLQQISHGKMAYAPIMLSLKAGNQTFFTKNVGIRGFFGLDTYSDNINYTFQKPPYNSLFMFFSLGIDLITEFALTKNNKHFLGTFFGLGGGAVIYTDNQSYTFFKDAFLSAGFIVEAGIDFTINIKHRISLGVKITPIQKKWSPSIVKQTDFLPFVNYQYKFGRDIFSRKKD